MSDIGSVQREASALRDELRALRQQVRAGEGERAAVARSLDEAQDHFRREHERLRRRNRALEREIAAQAEGLAEAQKHVAGLRSALEEQRRQAQEELAALRRHFDRKHERLQRQLREMDARLSRELEELRQRQDEYFAELRRQSDRRLASSSALCDLAEEMLAGITGDVFELALSGGLQQARYSVASARALERSGEAEAALGVADSAAALGFHLERERHRRRQTLAAHRTELLERCDGLLELLESDAVLRFLAKEGEGLRRQLRQWRTRIESGFREFIWFQAETREADDGLRHLAELTAALLRLAQECAELEQCRRDRLVQVIDALFAAFGDTTADPADWLTAADDRKADHALRFAVAGHTLRFRLPLRGGIVLEDAQLSSAHQQVKQALEGLLGARSVWHSLTPDAPLPGFRDPLLTALANPLPRR